MPELAGRRLSDVLQNAHKAEAAALRDRLVMLLTDSTSIGDVILFLALRHEA